jgi:hypothetical protein
LAWSVGNKIELVDAQLDGQVLGAAVASAVVPVSAKVAGCDERGERRVRRRVTKAVVRSGLEALGLSDKVMFGVRRVLSRGKADQVLVEVADDGGATVIRRAKGTAV